MTDLYDQRIDAMKAMERLWDDPTLWREKVQDERNAERLAAYKRKRISVVTIDDCAIFIDGVLRLYGDDVIPGKRH